MGSAAPAFAPTLARRPAGFNQSFYSAYHKLIPKAPGHGDRAQLYRGCRGRWSALPPVPCRLCAGRHAPAWGIAFVPGEGAGAAADAPPAACRAVLYHYLNHYNLFGSGYYNQCTAIMERLVPKLLVS